MIEVQSMQYGRRGLLFWIQCSGHARVEKAAFQLIFVHLSESCSAETALSLPHGVVSVDMDSGYCRGYAVDLVERNRVKNVFESEIVLGMLGDH